MCSYMYRYSYSYSTRNKLDSLRSYVAMYVRIQNDQWIHGSYI